MNGQNQRMQTISRLLRPKNIGLVGVSSKKPSSAGFVLENLLQAGYSGGLFLIHPTETLIRDRQAFASAEALPATLDVAVVSVPAARVLDALRDLEAASCASAVVTSAGFTDSEMGALRDFLAGARILVHGPNNMGAINLTDGVPLWTMTDTLNALPSGNIGFVAQSGAACVFVARSVTSCRFSKIISSGSEAGIDTADYIEWLAGDPATDAIGVVIESIRNVARFRQAVGVARAQGKPIVALKAGRSALGGKATQAHTGALIESGDFYQALFDDLDIASVSDYDEMAAVLDVYSSYSQRSYDRIRIASTTLSGGQCAVLADLAEDMGVELSTFGAETMARLETLLPGAAIANPIDVGGTPGASKVVYPDVMRQLLAEPSVDAIMVVGNGQSTLSPTEIAMEVSACNAVNAVASDADKPIIVASSSGLSIHPDYRALLTVPVPIVRGIQPALVAARALTRNRKPIRQPAVSDGGLPDTLRQRILAASGTLDGALSLDLARHYGIETVQSAAVANLDEALAAAGEIGYPLVVKVMSSRISHRSDVGGVVVGVRDADALAAAIASIEQSVRAQLPDIGTFGFELQSDLTGWVEVAGGFVGSGTMGTLVRAGMGGQLVELLDDGAQKLAPITAAEGAEMIASTKVGRVLGGYRRLHPPTVLEPLGDLLSRLSVLAADLSGVLAEGDINPIMVEPGTGRVRVVDLLFIKCP